jgi:integrase
VLLELCFTVTANNSKANNSKMEERAMPKRIAPLSDVQVRNAKPQAHEYKLADGYGLFLLVTPTGGKLWRLDYRIGDKRKTIALGQYPAVSLADARQRREDARKLLANGQDPAAVKKAIQEAAAVAAEIDSNTFEKVALEWFEKRKSEWVPTHAVSVKGRIDNYIIPAFGSMPIVEVKTSHIRDMLLKAEIRGAETARRVKVIINQIYRHAITLEYVENDPSISLKPNELFKKREVKHFQAITDPKELAPLLREIDTYSGSFIVKSALKLAPMLFVRPGELRKMEWAEVDLDAAEWSLPASKMKTRQPHIVPLSQQVLSILRELHQLTGGGKYVFAVRTGSRPMSENTINAALRYLGYDSDTMTGHGFRAVARTILDEVLGFRVDIIEHQLAHAVKDANGRAYNRTSFLEDRRKMMQHWADYLESLKAGAKVIPIHKAA